MLAENNPKHFDVDDDKADYLPREKRPHEQCGSGGVRGEKSLFVGAFVRHRFSLKLGAPSTSFMRGEGKIIVSVKSPRHSGTILQPGFNWAFQRKAWCKRCFIQCPARPISPKV